ncbi:MAG: sulfatase-like hydrolase/transferase, partial [Verrucomicrobiota bacterium]
RQIELGLIDTSWALSPKTKGIPDWDSLDEKKQDEMDLKMAVYAAMVDRVDQNIGKLVAGLKENGTFENTLILFLSDNGACQEGGMLGRGEFYNIERRNQQDANSYGEAWANAGSTPFRYYKHFAHEGGSATPFFMHWPDGIESHDDWYTDPAQLIDVLPTLIDVAGAEYPEERLGKEVAALDGVSLRPAFGGEDLNRSEPIFVEHERHAFARDGKWKLVGKDVSTIEGTKSGRWELYDMESDRTETNNLAKSEPKKLAELAAQWESWAEGVGVYPRGKRSPAPPTSSPAPAEKTEIKAERFKPQIAKTGFTIQAKVQAKEPEGVVLSQGGKAFGYSLYFDKGVPVFAWRNRSELTVVRGTEPVKGKVTLDVKVNRNTIFLRVNSKEAGRAEIKGFLAEQPGLGLYLGADGVHPVGEYKVPNRFSGKVLDYRILSDLRKVPMRTRWGNDVDPETVWAEYPRPQLRRENWTNLNGHWSYAVTPQSRKKAPEKWQGEILVPFAIEAPLSGVERRLLPEEYLWYSREFPLEKKKGQRYLLHFEAVDYESKVWVNGTEVGSNTGGNLPFALDITDAAQSGSNEVVVRVSDGTDTGHQLHGKQVLNPGGIWYTPVSGIWQTVWMEEVPDTYLSDIKITTKTSGRVEIRLGSEGGGRADATATVRLGGTEMAGAKAKGDRIELSIPNPRLWSPDDPALYQVEITMGEDKVQSYFGIRETGIERDEEGHLRFTLNGKPLFHWGTLDQGWWPDGLLTPPSEEAMVYDVQYLKDAGFNTIRKHIKVEPRRYYYACDRIGMLVWQDQVSSGTGRKRGEGKTSPEWTRLEPGGSDAEWPDEAHEQFMHELEVMIDTYHNHPSIVQWVPFNEAWGQHRTMKVGEWVVPYDPTRQINIASGGNFFPSGHIVDDHAYPHPEFDFESGANGRFDDFVKVMGEFGGHGFPVEGHLWSNETRNWGYGGIPKDKDEWLERYRTSIEMLADLKKRGIAGGIYTQTTDVEGEINGLITYDREVQKLKPEELREIGAILFDDES